MEPCGCSAEQIGGLLGRYDFIEHMGETGLVPVSLVDLGGLIKDPAQGAKADWNKAKSSSTSP